MCTFFFFQAEDGIRDLVRSRGLGDVYKRQVLVPEFLPEYVRDAVERARATGSAALGDGDRLPLSLIHI